MAKYSKRASEKVGDVLDERKQGTLKSGRSGKKVTSRKQAIAVGLSEARSEGAKVPKKKAALRKNNPPQKKAAKTSSTRNAAPKKKNSRAARKTSRKKGAPKKSIGRRGRSRAR